MKICPYCDFNRYLYEKVDDKRMKNAYLAELRYFLQLKTEALGRKPKIASVRDGSLTPLLLLLYGTITWHYLEDRVYL